MMELVEVLKTGPMVLFLWSLLCFFLGVFFCGMLHHYYLKEVIKKAEAIVTRLTDKEAP